MTGKQWRPRGLENPYPLLESGLPTNDLCYSQHDMANAFEEGADAMLGALKEYPICQYTTLEFGGKNLRAGLVVFISDNKEGKS